VARHSDFVLFDVRNPQSYATEHQGDFAVPWGRSDEGGSEMVGVLFVLSLGVYCHRLELTNPVVSVNADPASCIGIRRGWSGFCWALVQAPP
jgi:hypothetical protein